MAVRALCTLVLTLSGCVLAAAQTVEGAPPERVVYFPEDRSMGTLYVRPWGTVPASLYSQEWTALGDAVGAVTVPAGSELRLSVAETAVPDLSPLAYLGEADLQGISFNNSSVTDADLQYLAGMTTLRDVTFRNTSIGDTGLSYLDGMSNLDLVDLFGTEITDTGLAYLSSATGMRDLNLNRTAVTDAGLVNLEQMVNIQALDLWQTGVTDEGMAYLQNMTAMRILGLEDTLITDAGLAALADMRLLEQLILENNDITDEGLALLKGLKSLQSINLRDTLITGEGMEYLAALASLRHLSLPIQIGPEALAALKEKGVGGIEDILEEGAKRSVRVLDQKTRRGIAKAQLELMFTEDKEPNFLTCGPDGEAVFHLRKKYKASSLILTVNAEGYVPRQLMWEAPIPDELEVILEQGTAIGGVVVNHRNEPIEGVSVSMPMPGEHDWLGPGENLDYAVTSNASGQWRCDVAPGKLDGFWLRLNHPDYAETTYTMDLLSPAALRSLSQVLAMGPGLVLAGTVVDESNAPIPGAQVVGCIHKERHKHPMYIPSKQRATTNEQGRFELTNCDPGTLILRAQAPGYMPAVYDVAVEEGMAELVITLGRFSSLKGHVVDQAGEPIEGVSVSGALQERPGLTLVSVRTRTDARGDFVCAEVASEPMAYQFYKRGYRPLDAVLPPGPEVHRIVLEAAERSPQEVQHLPVPEPSAEHVHDGRGGYPEEPVGQVPLEEETGSDVQSGAEGQEPVAEEQANSPSAMQWMQYAGWAALVFGAAILAVLISRRRGTG